MFLKLKEETRMKTQPFTVENARLVYKNFAGLEGDYNNAGDRNFHVVIEDHDYARELEAQRYNITWPKPNPDIKPEDDERNPTLKVKIKFADIYIVKSGTNGTGRPEKLEEQDWEMLDWMTPKQIDLTVKPYDYSDRYSTGTGITAYLQELVMVVELTELQEKYGF